MKRIISLFTLLAICMVCLSGCGENYVSEEDKYNQYVRFNNTYLQVVDNSASRYFEMFGWEETLFVPEDVSAIPTFVLIAGIPANSERSMEFANKKPASVADATVLVLGEKSMNYVKVFEEICEYYNDKNYENDNFAKGQQLHTQYLKALEECEDAFGDFAQQLSVMEVDQLEKSLKSLEKSGNDYEYYLFKCIIEGQKMVNYLHQNDIDDTNLRTINKVEFEPLYQSYSKDFEGLTKEVKARDDWEYKDTNVQRYLQTLSYDVQIIQEILGGKEVDSSEKPIESIITNHNRAIDAYNARP